MTVDAEKTPEQRRAVVRTALILGVIALGFYLFTIFGGWW